MLTSNTEEHYVRCVDEGGVAVEFRAPSGDVPRGQWRVFGAAADANEAAVLEQRGPVIRLIGFAVTDAMITLRIGPFAQTGRPRTTRSERPQGVPGRPVDLDSCPPECNGPLHTRTGFAELGRPTGCCFPIYGAVNIACGISNPYCNDCCSLSACSTTCDSLFGVFCTCSISGRECSAGTGGQLPDGDILFCEPTVWPPDCT